MAFEPTEWAQIILAARSLRAPMQAKTTCDATPNG